MVNIGKVGIGNAPYFEDEASLKQWIRKQEKYESEITTLVRSIINQAGTGSEVELAEKGGLTLSLKGKTEISLKLACDTNDNAYDTKTVTGHYFTSAGVAKTFTATYNATDTTTEVACCSDFYCWDLINYTAATVLVSSVAVQAGDAVYLGTTGMVANAELRYATIAAAATYPVHTTLFGVGHIYGAEESNTAGDVGKVITLTYYTSWGLIRTASITLAADTTTIQRFVNTDTSLVVTDFYRVRTITTTANLGKYVCIAVDADKLVGTAALDTYYGVIEEGYHESMHTAYFGRYNSDVWLTQICCNNSVASAIDTYIKITYTPYGDTIAHTCIIALSNNTQSKLEPMLQLARNTDVKFEIKGNLSDNTFDIHIIEAVEA